MKNMSCHARCRSILIIPNVGKNGIDNFARGVASKFESLCVKCFFLKEDARAIGLDNEFPFYNEGNQEIDFVVVLGGDGTVLHAVSVMEKVKLDVPVMGINIGKIGFLTSAEMHDSDAASEMLCRGAFRLSERSMLACRLDQGNSPAEHKALNEIVIGKTKRERLIHLNTYINGEFFMRYSGDGLIFATSTGSTAYSLSSGGPIVTPDIKCILMTPICAHMLFSRPMVLGWSDVVTVKVEGEGESFAVSVDGRTEDEVPPDSSVEIYGSDRTVRLVELEGSSFYRTLRDKFLTFPDAKGQ